MKSIEHLRGRDNSLVNSMAEDPITLSVIICSYNRISYLSRLLESIEVQDWSSNHFEVLIVDNNSSDGTDKVSSAYCERHSNWQYIFEPRQGLSYARNRGWLEASGEYLLYIDDDCVLPKDYLKVAFQIIIACAPDFFGGPAYPLFDFKRPLWMRDEYFGNNIGIKTGYINNKFLSGCNMGIKKSILSEIGGFNSNYGLIGKLHGVGEDTLIQIDARLRKPETRMYFEQGLWLYHQIVPEKLDPYWSISRTFQAGKQYPYLTLPLSPELLLYKKGFINYLKKSFRLIFQILILGQRIYSSFFRDRFKYPHWQNYYYEQVKEEIFKFGYYLGVLLGY